VRDQTGAGIGGAQVTLKSSALTATKVTDAAGKFAFGSVPSETGTISVRSSGFITQERTWRVNAQGDPALEIVLEPAGFAEQVTVTAARTEARVSDTAASVIVLSEEDLKATAALTLDDALRQVEGFSLFRRSGSRTANPTSQGVSLRGVGASGASRALVISDGIPLNDPFGGWVYWDLIPRESIARVEVLQGAASSLYGTDALGGVINIVGRDPRQSTLSFEASYGNEETPDASLFASGRLGNWVASLGAAALHTDGYVIVDDSVRGRVDTPAGVEYTSADFKIERLLSDRARVFARGAIFGESRLNGTPLQTNNTHTRGLAIGGDWSTRASGDFSIRVYGGPQLFNQDFSSVAADRNSETLVRSQRVPAQQTGVMVQWSYGGSRQTAVAGIDAREVRGASDELLFVAGKLSSAVGAGGRERTAGVFVEDIIRVASRWLLTLGARYDGWRNYDALSTTRPLATPGPPVVIKFPDRTEHSFNPRAAVVHKLTENVAVSAAVYHAFRAPTLNELYRSFRLGNILTLANQNLRAERLTGGEAGASYAGLKGRLGVRGTFFWNEIEGPIANVTLATTPALITRQRQNLGSTRSRGIDINASARITNTVTLSGGYEFVDAIVLDFPANTALVGLRVPQVPRHQFTFQARYSNPSRFTLALQGRAIGGQFDDDQNQFLLGSFFTLDGTISRRIARGVELFGAVENMFNQRYAVALTPVKNLGPPVLGRFGIRFQIGSY
jgi:outer membrane receptor protein involved in Fe transport